MPKVLKKKKPAHISSAQIDLQGPIQTLRKPEDVYRSLVEKSPVAIAIVKGDKFLFVNKAFLEMFGWGSNKEVLESSIKDNLVSESRALRKRRGEKAQPSYEVKARKKDGTIFDAEFSAGLIRFQGEAARYWIIRDITQRKKTEQALRESEEKFRLFQSSVFDVIYRYDPQNNRYDFISPSVELQTGYSVEEFLSCPKEITERITHPEDWQRAQTEIKRQIAKGSAGKPFCVEYRIRRKDGREIWVSDQKTLEFSREGKLWRINGVVRDITDRKLGEETLRKSKELFEKTFNSQRDAIFLLDAKIPPTIIDCNPKSIEMFGYTRQEMLGRPTPFLHVDERTLKKFQECLYSAIEEYGFLYLPEFHLKRKDGTIFPTEHTVVPLNDQQGNRVGWVSVVRDITERKLTEEKLKEYTRQIEEKNRELEAKNQELTATRAQLVQKEKLRALGQMASGVAHNFNNLLAIILGRTELLLRKVKDLDIEVGLRSIEKAALDASATVKRIQDFTRIRKEQEFKWINIGEVIDEAIALAQTQWKNQAEANSITIAIEVQKDLTKLPLVAGDASELREVFTSILFNAAEAMPTGGKIKIRTHTEGESVFISFTDCGTGIPDEVKQKIFDPFFTTKGVKNTGLGLSVAYGIVQRHHGDIKVESRSGGGTMVVVRVPTSEIMTKEQMIEKKSEKPPLQPGSAKILVIEDKMGVRELLFEILTLANYLVKVASDGTEGLELHKREKFDIVFTDLGMPKMSGWEVAKAIKEIDSNTTVFLITGWEVEMDERKLKESGIDQIISKPIKVETLLTLVAETWESKRSLKEPVGEWRGSAVEEKEINV